MNQFAFSPVNFNNNINTTTNITFDEIVTNGNMNSVNIDIEYFDVLCRKFRTIHNVKIKDLKGQDKDDFNLVVSYVHLLRPTNYYNQFYEKVTKYFNDLEHIVPGTVGSYFGGCLVKTNYDESMGCSAICAGSIPRPKDDEGWSFCNKAVFFGEYSDKGYDFSVLKQAERPEDLNPCYIFIDKADKNFNGFTASEIKQLKDLGVENIQLISCDEKGTEYKNVYTNPIHIDNIKIRNEFNPTNLWLIILIFLFLFLLIIYSVWNPENA